jgi:hypothetical protein
VKGFFFTPICRVRVHVSKFYFCTETLATSGAVEPVCIGEQSSWEVIQWHPMTIHFLCQLLRETVDAPQPVFLLCIFKLVPLPQPLPEISQSSAQSALQQHIISLSNPSHQLTTMKLFALTLIAFTSTISASAAASPGLKNLSVRATKCNQGAVYCGWWLIDQNGNYFSPKTSPYPTAFLHNSTHHQEILSVLIPQLFRITSLNMRN